MISRVDSCQSLANAQLSMRAFRRRDGKPDAKFGAAGNRFHVNFSVGAANQLANDVQAEAGSGAYRLCRKEWIEDAIANIFRDSGAVVDNANDDVIAFAHSTCLDMPVLTDSIQRVIDQIGPHLIQFA